MNRTSPRSRSSRTRITRLGYALGIVAAVSGCTKKGPAADVKAETETGRTPAPATSAPAPATAIAGPRVAAQKLERGQALGHFMIGDPLGLITGLNTQLKLPIIEENFLRGQLGKLLGPRQVLAEGLDLARPLGCVALAIESWSCVVGYRGGVGKLVEDMGTKGKQGDAGGHAAHFKVNGDDLFIDPLGEAVALSTAPDAFATTRSYLETNLLGRASKPYANLEVIVYLDETMKKYEEQIKPLLDMADKQPPPQSTGDAKLDKVMKAWAEYGNKGNRNQFARMGEMTQVSLGLALDPTGLVGRMASFPAPGSRLERENRAQAGTFDDQLLGSLPASSWLVIGASQNRTAAWNTETTQELRTLMAQTYADLTGKPAKQAEAAVKDFVEANEALYQRDSAFAFAHEPDTMGGVVVIQPMKDGHSGRDAWSTWAKAFTPDNVLDTDSQDIVTWQFHGDAAAVDGVPVDRWVIEPGPKTRTEIENNMDATMRAVIDRLGGLRLVIDRGEVDGTAVFVVAPGAEEAYMKAAVSALRGTGKLAGAAGLDAVTTRPSGGATMMLAADGKRAANWLRAIAPPDKASKVPAGIGNDLSDLYVWFAVADNGNQAGEVVISQRLIHQARGLMPM